jgi:hypothetical protein
VSDSTKITPADIEAKLRNVQGQVDSVKEDSKKKMTLIGGGLVALLVLVIYLVGRNAGKKKSTVLEIRRL